MYNPSFPPPAQGFPGPQYGNQFYGGGPTWWGNTNPNAYPVNNPMQPQSFPNQGGFGHPGYPMQQGQPYNMQFPQQHPNPTIFPNQGPGFPQQGQGFNQAQSFPNQGQGFNFTQQQGFNQGQGPAMQGNIQALISLPRSLLISLW